MTTAVASTGPATGLATLLREGTREEHRHAERQSFVTELLAGNLSAEAYLGFVTRLTALYGSLESVGELLADDPLAVEVVDPALHRSAALRADLAYWWARAGRDPSALDPDEQVARVLRDSPATAAYVETVVASASWGGLYVAHHYTRYLGDLSGGRAIGRVLTRAFELQDHAGVRFFEFPEITKVVPYKDRYRARLDALPVDEAGQRRVLEEVKVAFALNEAVFAELHP